MNENSGIAGRAAGDAAIVNAGFHRNGGPSVGARPPAAARLLTRQVLRAPRGRSYRRLLSQQVAPRAPSLRLHLHMRHSGDVGQLAHDPLPDASNPRVRPTRARGGSGGSRGAPSAAPPSGSTFPSGPHAVKIVAWCLASRVFTASVGCVRGLPVDWIRRPAWPRRTRLRPTPVRASRRGHTRSGRSDYSGHRRAAANARRPGVAAVSIHPAGVQRCVVHTDSVQFGALASSGFPATDCHELPAGDGPTRNRPVAG
jgi:hypothetical protein